MRRPCASDQHTLRHGHCAPTDVAGAEVDARDTREQMTPLHEAALMGHVPLIETLCLSGARTDLRATALWTASAAGGGGTGGGAAGSGAPLDFCLRGGPGGRRGRMC